MKCADIDECAEGIDDCHRRSNATCDNVDGSFVCTCRDGFTGNGTSCEGIYIRYLAGSFQIELRTIFQILTSA